MALALKSFCNIKIFTRDEAQTNKINRSEPRRRG